MLFTNHVLKYSLYSDKFLLHYVLCYLLYFAFFLFLAFVPSLIVTVKTDRTNRDRHRRAVVMTDTDMQLPIHSGQSL